MGRFNAFRSNAGIALAAGAVGFAGVYGLTEPQFLGDQALAALSSECNIKGNIAAGGERIYHIPGQMYYSDTVISLRKGERWFCTEPQARAAAWRKSRV